LAENISRLQGESNRIELALLDERFSDLPDDPPPLEPTT
jgi:hypothetical protein